MVITSGAVEKLPRNQFAPSLSMELPDFGVLTSIATGVGVLGDHAALGGFDVLPGLALGGVTSLGVSVPIDRQSLIRST